MKKRTIKSFILLAFLLISTTILHAIPAYPDPVVVTQPDGKTLTVMIKGDERINWNESMDGYTLLHNQDGFLTYARLDENGNLQPSNLIATDIEERDIVITSFLNTIEKNLFYSEAQTQIMHQVWQIEDEIAEFHASRGVAVIGEYKSLCALVQFPEKSFIKELSDFEGLMNQLGYTQGGAVGSVRDFFKESSYNQFDLTVTLCGIYTAPESQSYYAGSSGTHQNCQILARWAAQQVANDPADIDFSEYVGPGGNVSFHFIFAGRGREAGGGSGTIWSHKWQFSPSVSKNGKSINIYSCSPELINASTITTIGVICHEMTHAVLGAPDFYDTSSNGSYTGTGNWDIMAGGSWNGSPGGNRPAHHNMFTKIQTGWVTPVVLNSQLSITNMPNSAENPVAYRINTTTNNEYYLLENRQRIKFDAGVPGAGLIIYHVHSQVNQAANNNNVNATHPQRMYPVCASRTTQMPTAGASNYGSINSGGCPFPGTSNKSSFTDNSTPAMKSWANANTEKPITNIVHSGGLVSFDFMNTNNYTITATCGENGSISPSGATTAIEGESIKYTITPNTHYERETVLVNGTNNTTAVTSGSYTFTNITSNQNIHATFAPKTYRVTFNSNSGTGTMDPQNFTYGVAQNLTANSFEREGYIFEKWCTNASGTGTSYPDEASMLPSSNITLYAQWIENVSIEENEARNSILQIIPNPANDYVDLRFTIYDLRVESIEFYNTFGQLVKSVPYHINIQDNIITQRISIADLSKGVYLVRAGNKTAKLVVQ